MARPKKEQRFSIVRIKSPNGSTSFRVQGYCLSGERIRKNFKFKADAIEHVATLEAEQSGHPINYTLRRTTMSDGQLRDAEQALKYAGDRTLTESVLRLTEAESSLTERLGIGLEQAMAFVRSHYRSEVEEISISSARDLFLNSRTGITAQTQQHYENVTKLLIGSDPNLKVHEITVRHLSGILSQYKNANSKKTFQNGFCMFFNWAVRNHYCLENPCDRLDKIPAVMSNVEILSLESVKQLLKATLQFHDGVMAASIAILLFAGLRPSELFELDSKDIRKDVIRVKGGKLRREINRSVPIHSVLKSWLDVFPFTGLPKGWRYKMNKLKKASGAGNWVNDILRHTSISYQLERDKDEAKTAFHCGTSPKMINRHYRDVIDEADRVSDFWALTPEAVKDVDLKGDLPARHSVLWPTDAELKKLVWEKPLSQLAKDIGASDTAIRKRCIKHGVKLPKNGHWQKERMKAKT